jgi:hypothetical protein
MGIKTFKRINPKELSNLILSIKLLKNVAKNKHVYIIINRKRARYFIQKGNLIYLNKIIIENKIDIHKRKLYYTRDKAY